MKNRNKATMIIIVTVIAHENGNRIGEGCFNVMPYVIGGISNGRLH